MSGLGENLIQSDLRCVHGSKCTTTMNLKEKVCVVTGASSGLGAEFARAMAGRGAFVFGLARRTSRLNQLERDLGPQFRGIECDVTDESAVSRAFETIRRDVDVIDVLINNAGLARFGAVEDTSTEDWNDMMDVNLKGVFLCTREVVPAMKRQNARSGFGGHIVNICSVAGLVGNANISTYNATKFGLRGYSEALFKELRHDGIKVSCIYPGSVETEFYEVAGTSITSNPLQAADVAASVVHLLESPDNYLVSEIVVRPLRPRG